MRNRSKTKPKTQSPPTEQPNRRPTGERAQSQAPPVSQFPSSLILATSDELLQLQRTVGNRVVNQMLEGRVQRVDDGPLEAAQVSKAISYYGNRSEQYTESIIRQIQTALGLPATGTVDEAMVQAAARWQEAHPPLWVDGMVGPRTLPALFRSGLAEQESIETFAGDARGVIEGDWASMTQEERADALLEKVNERLVAANVPEVGRDIQDLGGDAGQFDFEQWFILLDDDTFSSDTLSEDTAADLADTVYHEARHAEQWYRIAQMLAGQGRTARQIADEMGIPARIAAAAFADPLAPDSMEALIADGWYQSIYGTGSAHRERVLGPTGTFEEYRRLPEESDAWRVGGGVTEAYNQEEEEDGGGG